MTTKQKAPTGTLTERRRALGVSRGMVARAAKISPVDATLGETRIDPMWAYARQKIEATIERWETDGAPTPTPSQAADLARELRDAEYMDREAEKIRAKRERLEAQEQRIAEADTARIAAVHERSARKRAYIKDAIAEMREVRARSGLTQVQMGLAIGETYATIVNAENGHPYAVSKYRDLLAEYVKVEEGVASEA